MPKQKQMFAKKNEYQLFRLTRKQLLIICTSIVATVIALMTIAAFFDYQIDWIMARPWLKNPNVTATGTDSITGISTGDMYSSNMFAKIIEMFGTVPSVCVTLFSMAIFYHNASRIKKSTKLRRTVKGFCVGSATLWTIYAFFFQFFPLFGVCIYGSAVYGANVAPLDQNGWLNPAHMTAFYTELVFAIILGAVVTLATFLIFKQINNQLMSELLRWAMVTSCAGVFAMLGVEVAIKTTFQRERFRVLMAYGNVDPNNMWNVPMWVSVNAPWMWNGQSIDGLTKWWANGGQAFGGYGWDNVDPYGGFHPWYALPVTPYGYGSTGNTPLLCEDQTKSFPSGHETAAGMGFLSLIILPFTTHKFSSKKWRYILFTTAIAGVLLVGLGRIVAGAHYLSDVVIGATIAGGLLAFFYWLNCYHASFLDKWCGFAIKEAR
ncbi:MAG: phosphatase PAP2 family protein [Mycoplasmataceae bacterium]|nr:phosphatase PAP2 family protein [Mycoplasmataceae bacterium]